MLSNFFHSNYISMYDFGPQHPLKPVRLARTMELLNRYGVESVDPGIGSDVNEFDPGLRFEKELLRVHDAEYVEVVKALSLGQVTADPYQYGLAKGDTPHFRGMFDAALAYTACTVEAAKRVAAGAPIAFAIGGGLHHAHRNRASGFCVFNDASVACDILLEKFDRVAYVDIDVHHGDGVQWMFFDDPRVLTCSIHEEGRTLFPGTGGLHETGAAHTSLNVPIQARTTGDVWLSAFLRTIPLAVEKFGAQAIVLQLGTDTHEADPLGHVRCRQQDWLAAVREVASWKLPIVAVGGGGYNLTTVPRMWASACLTLGGQEFDDRIPKDLADKWNMPTFSDAPSETREIGKEYADGVVDWLLENHVPQIGR